MTRSSWKRACCSRRDGSPPPRPRLSGPSATASTTWTIPTSERLASRSCTDASSSSSGSTGRCTRCWPSGPSSCSAPAGAASCPPSPARRRWPMCGQRSARPRKRRPRIVVRLRPQSLLDPEALRTLLRRELLHVADMLDPAFGYLQGAARRRHRPRRREPAPGALPRRVGRHHRRAPLPRGPAGDAGSGGSSLRVRPRLSDAERQRGNGLRAVVRRAPADPRGDRRLHPGAPGAGHRRRWRAARCAGCPPAPSNAGPRVSIGRSCARSSATIRAGAPSTAAAPAAPRSTKHSCPRQAEPRRTHAVSCVSARGPRCEPGLGGRRCRILVRVGPDRNRVAPRRPGGLLASGYGRV